MNDLERAFFINQYEILIKLSKNQMDISKYQYKIDILKSGYVGLYYEIVGNLEPEISEEIYRETCDILNMYRNINNSIDLLNIEQKEKLKNLDSLNNLSFRGFDGNEEEHYGILEIMKERGKWAEIDSNNINSHHSYLTNYKLLLIKYNNIQRKKKIFTNLSFDELVELIK